MSKTMQMLFTGDSNYNLRAGTYEIRRTAVYFVLSGIRYA